MPLILKRNDHKGQGDRFRVYSGKAVVGVLMRVPNGEKQGWWHWSITGFFVSPEDQGPFCGNGAEPGEGYGGLRHSLAPVAQLDGAAGERARRAGAAAMMYGPGHGQDQRRLYVLPAPGEFPNCTERGHSLMSRRSVSLP
jgi:hypothetical protein